MLNESLSVDSYPSFPVQQLHLNDLYCYLLYIYYIQISTRYVVCTETRVSVWNEGGTPVNIQHFILKAT